MTANLTSVESIESGPPAFAGSRRLEFKKKFALALVCLAMLLPFIDKPLHVDDPMYVWTARQIVAHPADFYGFAVNWEGHDVPVSRFCENPPLVAYYLAAVSPLARWTEVGFHTAFLPFAVLSVLGLYKLAARFCRRPALASLLLIACPAFVVSSTTLMCEPPLLCLWVWAVWLWIDGTDRRPALLPVAGLLAAVAMLTKYSALSLFPLLTLYAIVRPGGRKLRILQAISLAIPVVAVAGYELLTSRLYGTGALGGASRYVADTRHYHPIGWIDSAVNTVTFVGGSAVPVALLAISFVGRTSRRFLAAVFVTSILVTGRLVVIPPAWVGRLGSSTFFFQAAALTFGGAVMIALLIVVSNRAVRTGQWRDETFLIGWILGVYCFTAVVNWSVNVRSVLPMMPPLCILLARALDATPRLPKFCLVISLAIGATVSLAVARGDYQQAVTSKLAAEQLTAGKSPPVWFCGHWGFQYYMQFRGGRIVDELTPQVRIGDSIIYPRSHLGGAPGSTGLVRLRSVRVGPDSWAATQLPALGGGFYDSAGHSLPYVFGRVEGETFDVMRVTAATKIKP